MSFCDVYYRTISYSAFTVFLIPGVIDMAKRSKSYNVMQVAQIYSVSYDTVLRWIRCNRLSADKVTTLGLRKEWRISDEQLEKFEKYRKSDE